MAAVWGSSADAFHVQSLEKEKSRCRNTGGQYEYEVAALAALRLRSVANLRFKLWTNVTGANPFDDLVVLLLWTNENGVESSLTYLIQLKHKEDNKPTVTSKNLGAQNSGHRGPFNLRHYYFEFKKAVKEIENASEEQLTATQSFLRQCFRGDFRLCLYTTREVLPCRKHTRAVPKMTFPFEETFTTGQGESFSLGAKDTDIWNMLNSEDEELENDFRHNFLSRLRIFSGQAPEFAMAELLEVALADVMGKESDRLKLIQSRYCDFLQRWWQRNDGDCLSSESLELEEILLDEINDIACNNLTFKSEYYDALEKEIINKSVMCTIIPGISSSLRSSVLKGVLDRSFPRKYAIVTDETLMKFTSDCLIAVCLKLCKAVVISLDDNEASFDLLKKLYNHNIVCIMTVKDESEGMWEKIEEFGMNEVHVITNEWVLNQLTESQQKALTECPVLFQGEEVTLESVEPHWPSLRECIGGFALGALTEGRVLPLGAPLPPVHPHYVTRAVQHRSVLNRRVLQVTSRHDCFVLKNFDEETLRALRAKNSPWEECSSSWRPKSMMIPLDGSKSPLLEGDPIKTKWTLFDHEVEERANKNIHWLSKEDDTIIWDKSEGDCSFIANFVEKKSSNCQNRPICCHDRIDDFINWTDETVILTDCAGMGKTTFLIHVAHTIKKAKKSQWVIVLKVNEGHIFDTLTENVEMSDVLTMLLNVGQYANDQSNKHLVRSFLEESLYNGGITVMLDGVDEVCPAHKDKVLRVLNLLRDVIHENGGKLWVSARTVLEEDLTEVLRCKTPLSLRSFSHDDQKKYLLRRWTEPLRGVDRREQNRLVDGLVHAARRATESGGSSLCDVILYTSMLADAYVDNGLQQLLRDKTSNSQFQRINLYKMFVEKTVNIMWEKSGITESIRRNYGIETDALEKPRMWAALICFDKVFLGDYCYRQLVESMHTMNNSSEKEKIVRCGVVTEFVDGKAKFIHHTIAEFLASWWLKDRYIECLTLVKELYLGELGECRYFFDAFLVENRPLHEAALAGGVEALETAMKIKFQRETVNRDAGEYSVGNGSRNKSVSNINLCKMGNQLKDRVDKHEQILSKMNGFENERTERNNDVFEVHGLGNICCEDKAERCNDYGRGDERGGSEVGDCSLGECERCCGGVNDSDGGGRRPLHLAAIADHPAAVTWLLSAGASVSPRDAVLGWTPLRYADAAARMRLRNGVVDVASHVHVMERLLEAQGDPQDMPRTTLEPALIVFAINNSSPLVATEIIKRTMSPCADDLSLHSDTRYANEKHINNALFAAVFLGNDDLCLLILNRGGNVHALGDNGFTLLHTAAERGHESTCRLLLERGIGVEARSDSGSTPLTLAAANGHSEVCLLLLERGASPTAKGQNGSHALLFAVEKGHVDAARVLLEHKADPNARNDYSYTPVLLAALFGQTSIFDLLLSYGANIDALGENNSTALHFAAERGFLSACEYLLEKGADPNIANIHKSTPFISAAWRRHPDVWRLLLKHGADVNAKGENDSTALHFVSELGYDDICGLLLEDGADVNATNVFNCTPLTYAVNGGHELTCLVLLKNGADVHVRTNDGYTALLYAISKGYEDICRALLDFGACVNDQADDGMSALCLGREVGNDEICRMLVEKGTDTTKLHTKK